jgi:hypothetical protein
MKTTINQPPLCREFEFGRLSRSSRFLRDLFLSLLVRTKSFCLKRLSQYHRLHVSRAILAGLSALISSATVNARRYLGLACIGVFAPLSSISYRLFNEAERDFSWYYYNMYYLFRTLGEHSFQPFFLILGVFLALPKNFKAQYWIAPFIGYPVIKALLIINCSSNEQWHESIHWSLYVAMFLIGLCVTLGINFFSWVRFHKWDGVERRMDGLFQAPFAPDEKEKLLKEVWTEYKNLKRQY